MPTVSNVAMISSIGAPDIDHQLSIGGYQLSGNSRKYPLLVESG